MRVNRDEALPPFESVTDNASVELIIPIPILVEQLNLKLFDAADGELSICLGEAPCLYFAQQIKAWRCASNVCEQGDGLARSAGCFADQFRSYSDEDQTKISQAICSIVKSPTKETRISLLDLVPDMSEHVLIENSAYLWAFKKNVDQCVAVIKDYVGEFGPNWNFRWYRALSGCRILAQESTRVKEEKDYHKWLSIQRGEGQCSDIKIKTLREACEAPGSAYPKPGYEFIPGISSLDVTSKQTLLDLLQLNEYLGAGSDDLSLCNDYKECLELMDKMKYWTCADKVCDSSDEGTYIASCFGDWFSSSSNEVRDQANKLICNLIKVPGKDSRQAFIKATGQEALEDVFVLDIAKFMAMKGDALSCQQHIIDYLGPYGARWKPVWYAGLSGCRILARESTYEQERKDFATWFAVLDGVGNCSSIINNELKNACNTPGAASPKPIAEK